MTKTPPQETLSDLVAGHIRAIRTGRGWSAARLAEECAKAGYPQLTESVIANIETGRRDQHGRRRREVTIDELGAFCMTFQLPMSTFLSPFAPSSSMDPRQRAWLEETARQLDDLTQEFMRISNAFQERLFPPPDQEHHDG